MQQKIQKFKNEQFGEIRIMVDGKGEPWFAGKDVAEMLGYKKSRNALMAHVDADDKKDALIQGPLGGLYSLVLASKPKVWG